MIIEMTAHSMCFKINLGLGDLYKIYTKMTCLVKNTKQLKHAPNFTSVLNYEIVRNGIFEKNSLYTSTQISIFSSVLIYVVTSIVEY